MKLDAEPDVDLLTSLGAQAIELLCRGDISTLARDYGYALSYGRDTVTAIQDDLRNCLAEAGATSLTDVPPDPVRSVKYFKPDASNVVAVIECLARADNGTSLLVELIVTSKGLERHITLEQLSADATSV